MAGYHDIAADLRAAIIGGDYVPGSTIPKLEELQVRYGAGKETVRRAISVLQAEGLVVPIRRRGTVVRDRTPVRLAVSRYQDVLAADGALGPWETACALQGVLGRTDLIGADLVPADLAVAALLEVPDGTPAIRRSQHMLANDLVVQIQETWLPAALAQGTTLAEPVKARGGIYRTLADLGHPPVRATETVTSRMPTRPEAEILQLGPGTPVLAVDRVTRDAAGAVLALARAIVIGDRIQLVYDQALTTIGE